MLALLENYVLTHVITTFGKKAAGSLRPNFLALCGWDGTKCAGNKYEIQRWVAIILQTAHALVYKTSFANWVSLSPELEMFQIFRQLSESSVRQLKSYDYTHVQPCSDPNARKYNHPSTNLTLSGRQSFPSGHSSGAMAGQLFISLFLAQQISILQPRYCL